MTKKLVSSLSLILICICSPSYASDEKTFINLEQAINIAKNEVKIPNQVITADESNSAWNEHLQQRRAYWEKTKTLTKLKNKNYWAISFKPDLPKGTDYVGGDIWVFVDKNDGSVIDSYFGA